MCEDLDVHILSCWPVILASFKTRSTFSLQWPIPLCWNFPCNFIPTSFGQIIRRLPTSTFQAMNPGLRSTTYDVNDLFSTSDQKREIEKDKTQSWPRTLLKSTDIYIMIKTYIHRYIYINIHIYFDNYIRIYIYIDIFFNVYIFGCSPQIYCTYLMFGWFSCLFTMPKAYFVEEQTDFIFALHLKSARSKRLTNRVFSIKVQKHINNLLFWVFKQFA